MEIGTEVLQKIKNRVTTLTSMAQLIGSTSVKRKVSGSILIQATCLGWEFGPHLGHIQETTN